MMGTFNFIKLGMQVSFVTLHDQMRHVLTYHFELDVNRCAAVPKLAEYS